MGCKALKAHYGIQHIVHVVDGGAIAIGSPYLPIIILITDGDPEWKLMPMPDGELDDVFDRMVREPDVVRALIATPDTFERAIPVWTFDYDGNIVEHACEKPGWPNTTHDGVLMYENRFSTDRSQVVAWARENLALYAEHAQECVAEASKQLEEKRKARDAATNALAKLLRSEGKAP